MNTSQPGNLIKGTVQDVTSDAIPYLKIVADSPRWSMNLGLVQQDIFDVKLDMSSENKIYFGLVKRAKIGNNPGDFYAGELNYNNKKYQIQIYVERLPCSDNGHQSHNARITMLKEEKEYYACGDFLN
ncbi:MAG: hypothetical protein ABIO44_11140, partial [Saprospiraceae bacterium]